MHKRERGSVSVETLFALIILAMLIFGGLELGRAYTIKHSLDAGAYQAARYLSLHPTDTATAISLVKNQVRSNLGSGVADAVQVTVNMPSSTFQSVFTVRATVTYIPVVRIPFVTTEATTLQSEYTQAVEKYP